MYRIRLLDNCWILNGDVKRNTVCSAFARIMIVLKMEQNKTNHVILFHFCIANKTIMIALLALEKMEQNHMIGLILFHF